MRILIVQNTDWLRRNPAQQHHLAELLSQRGHDIRVIDFEILWRYSPRREYISKRQVFNNVTKVHADAKISVYRPSIIKIPLLDYISFMLSAFKEVLRQIKIFSPDVIVSLGIVAVAAGLLARLHRIPFFYYWIDVSHRLIPVKFLQPIGWMIERINLKLADKIFVINKKLGYYVIRNGADPEKVTVLGAGIYFDKFNPNLDGSFIREQYGISENDVVLFFMGWLYKFSGLREVALKLLEMHIKNVKLLIVGDGDLYDELQEIKNRLDKNNSIILAGRRPYNEIPYYIAAANICILPAYTSEKIMRDIVPIKIYEYMAMGKPVIATKLPGVMLEFGMNNGITFVDRPEDVVKMALHMIENNILKELGDKARRSVEKYNWNYIVSEFEDTIKKVVEERRSS
ncbi:MAG: glycosyltransferase family 4 protein [Candidatus Njordarchaeota archaeon]